MRVTAFAVAMGALVVLPGNAIANADDAAGDAVPAECRDGSITCLDRIQVTATRRPESTFDVPAATTIVGAGELLDAAPQTAMDALHGAVGTFVQQTTPGQSVVIVRGLKGSEVLHLVDGFRLNNAIFRNAPNQYIALVDAQSLDRIEVVRGPSSTLYGGDAMGGVVQMLSAEPRFNGTGWQARGRVRGIHASADDSLLGRAEFAAGREGFVLSGGVTGQDAGTLRAGNGERLRPTAFSARAADFKLRARMGEGHELMASAQYFEQPRTPRYDALVPGFGQARAESAVFLFEPQRREFTHLRWRINQPNALFDNAELHLGRQRIVDDRRTRETDSRNEDRERNRDTLLGVTGQFGKALGDDHYLGYGFEAYLDEVASGKVRTDLDSGAASARAPRFPDGSSMRTQALYLADDWRAGRLDVNAGLRYSRFDIEIPGSAAASGVRLTPEDVTGNIGVSLALGEDWRFVSNFGRGFRAPNIFDLGVFGPRPGNRFSVPNPQLTPESVLSWDAGFKLGGERLGGELIAFRSRYRDKITSVLTGEVQPNGAQVVQNRNITELELWGIEAGAYWRLVSPELELYATATYTRGQERLAGSQYPADRIPPLFGKLGTRWRAGDAMTLEAYALYAARQGRLSPRDATDPRINPDGTAGWVTWNARLDWKASQRLGLALRIENLGDRRYREHGSGLDEPGRNFILTADYRF